MDIAPDVRGGFEALKTRRQLQRRKWRGSFEKTLRTKLTDAAADSSVELVTISSDAGIAEIKLTEKKRAKGPESWLSQGMRAQVCPQYDKGALGVSGSGQTPRRVYGHGRPWGDARSADRELPGRMRPLSGKVSRRSLKASKRISRGRLAWVSV